jgi:cytochrome c biogenesis protein CcmG/thiol:disulfide interchange protein DsbE
VSARSFAVFMAVLAVVGLLAYGLISKGGDAIAVGQPVPDRELGRLDGGGSGRIADYRGRWVLVNLWASWCQPCRQESPLLERFYRRYRDRGFVVLGIDLDDATQDARSFARHYGLTYPLLHEGNGADLRKAFGASGYPESFLVDPRGRLRLIRRGPVTEDYLRHFVVPLL